MTATWRTRRKSATYRALLVFQGIFFIVAVILPLLTARASAVPTSLTNRVATTTTGVPSATFTFGVQFRLPSSSIVRQVEVEFCTTPVGSCTATPGTDTPIVPASSTVTQNNTASVDNWTDVTTFGTFTRSGGRNGGTNNQLTVSRASSTSETQSGSNDRGFTFTGFTNTSTANQTYYPRIRLYSDLGTTEVFNGVTAQSTSQNLTVNARVQEILSFCIGTTTVDDATTQITNSVAANVVSCAQADGTSIDLGVISNTTISTTPVGIVTGGDAKLAYAMVQTNAQNGIVVSYRAVQDASSGKLKVIGSACSGVSTTDQCFNSAGTTATAFTPGTENFGMTIAGVNCASSSGSYTCNYAASGTNLCLKANYSQAGYTCGAGNSYVTSADTNVDGTTYAWVDTGSSLTDIAGSDASTLKVVANEALMLKFAATSQVTTPTGIYQAQADFVATPTF